MNAHRILVSPANAIRLLMLNSVLVIAGVLTHFGAPPLAFLFASLGPLLVVMITVTRYWILICLPATVAVSLISLLRGTGRMSPPRRIGVPWAVVLLAVWLGLVIASAVSEVAWTAGTGAKRKRVSTVTVASEDENHNGTSIARAPARSSRLP